MPDERGIRAGVRAALPFVLPTLVLGASFGVLAKPVMGPVAPIVMSVLVFSGGAQFAALSVLASGGTTAAAIAAGLLMNARWVPMGFAIGPSLRGGLRSRALQGQAIVDARVAGLAAAAVAIALRRSMIVVVVAALTAAATRGLF